jgi:hypothetical protein
VDVDVDVEAAGSTPHAGVATTAADGGAARSLIARVAVAAQAVLGSRALPVVVGCLPYAAAAVVALYAFGARDAYGADGSLLQMATRRAVHFDQLVGPYSRFGWNHPGPALFYWYAPFFALSGQTLGSLGLAAALLNLIGAASIGAIVLRAAGRRAAWAAGVALCALFVATGAEAVLNPWNPYLTVLPVGVTLVAAAACAAGDPRLLPVVALAGTVAVQTHLGTIVVVGALALLAVGGLVFHLTRRHGDDRRDRPAWRGAVVMTVVAGAVLWAPPAYQQLTAEPGNLGEIASYVRSGQATQPWGVVDGPVIDLASLASSRIGIEAGGAGWASPLPDADAGELAVLAGLVAAALAVCARGRGRTFERSLAAASLVALGAAALSAKQVTGDFVLYAVVFVLAVGMGLWLTAAVAVSSFWLGGDSAAVRRLRLGGAVLVTCVTLVVAGRAADVRAPYDPDWLPDSPVPSFARAAVAAAEEQRARSVSVAFIRGSDWPTASAVANELERAGVEVAVPEGMGFVFGEDYVATGDEDYHLVVAPPDGGDGDGDAVSAELPADASELASVGDLALYGTDSAEIVLRG